MGLSPCFTFFFFNDTATTEIYTLSLHDALPILWVGDKIYFLSDRDGPVSLFSYDMHAKEVKKELENRGLDLKSASAGPDAIVYEQFGSLHLYDLKSGTTKQVNVRIAGDLLERSEEHTSE